MRRFELNDQQSNEFWEVSTKDSSLTVRCGRIGTAGQTTTRDLESVAAASAEADALVREKTTMGYVEIGVAPAGTDEPDEAAAATLHALADIEVWFADEGATKILADLNPPATDDALGAAETALGRSLPSDVRALYRRHDGQRSSFERGNQLFPNGIGSFNGLSLAVRMSNGRLGRFISPYFADEASESERLRWKSQPLRVSPESTVPRSWMHLAEGNVLLPEECSTAWFMFAWQETFYGLVHLRTGRVFQWTKDEGLSLLAASFAAFLAKFADDLRNGKRAIERDDSDPDEPADERRWVWRD